ncbi:MAG: hypothetical protein OHK0023_08710 [Anaerolineae bacterium]
MSQRTTWESIKTLFSPKTIPFLIAQGAPRRLLPVGTLILGLILGFIWAYGVSPNVYTAAEPVHLGESWKEEYVKQVAWQFSLSGQAEVAQKALDGLGNAGDVVGRMLQNPNFANDPDLGPKLQAIAPYAINNPAQLAKITPTFLNSNLTPVLCVIAAALLIGGFVIFNMIIPVTLLLQRPKKSTDPSAGLQEKERRRQLEEASRRAEELNKQQEEEARKAAAPGTAPTIVRSPVEGLPQVSKFMSAYLIGDDFYDDTFSIETANDEFLGETGAGIAKVIGPGDPKKVTALECFVFDKTDIRTVTKVLMSQYAFNDQTIRDELAPRGDAVLVKPGETIYLETLSLIVRVRVIDLAYGSGALPENSFFDRLTLEISAFQKQGSAQPPMPPGFDETSPLR